MARYEIEEMVLNGDTYEFRDNTAQEELVSGTNIKTINNESILGSGNLEIGGGGTTDYDQLSNRPEINSQVLTGDLSSKDLGLFNVPTYTGDITDIVTESGVTFCIVRIPIFVPPTSTSIYIPINIGKPILFPSGGSDYRIRIITETSTYNYSVYINGVAVSTSQATLMSGTYLAKIDTSNGRIYFATGGAIPDIQNKLTAGTDMQINGTTINFTNSTGYITGINATDVTTALGYTPQEELVSGTNIKTIDGESLLGSGNVFDDIFARHTTNATDVDTSMNMGLYYCTGATSNRPTSNNGYLIVFRRSSSLVLQFYVQYQITNFDMYMRKYNSGWGAWKKITFA